MSQVALRPVDVGDLDAIFEQMRDPESVRMAAFTHEDPSDRSGFDAHMARVMSSPENRLRAVIRDSRLVGTIASYVSEGAIALAGGKGSQRGRSDCSSRRSRFGRSEPVLRAATRGRYDSFRRRASTRSGPKCPLPPDGPPRSRRPFSSCPEHLRARPPAPPTRSSRGCRRSRSGRAPPPARARRPGR
jgi:hypothetical protein